MALGASACRSLRGVLGQGLKLVTIGIVLGAALSLLLSHAMASLWAGLSAADPAVEVGPLGVIGDDVHLPLMHPDVVDGHNARVV
jgi:hypothetical protein